MTPQSALMFSPFILKDLWEPGFIGGKDKFKLKRVIWDSSSE